MFPSRGFTLIELILVLVIAGILAVAMWPRAVTKESLTLNARAEQLASDIRYVQTLSMTRGSRYCVVITGTSYQLEGTTSNVCDVTKPEPNPVGMGASQPISLCDGCAVTSATVQFTGLGVPASSAGAALGADTTIQITDSGVTKTVTITQTTGRVIVQ